MIANRTLAVAAMACILAAPAVRAESLERPSRRGRNAPTEPNWRLQSPQVRWMPETMELSVSVTVENSGEGNLPPTSVRAWRKSERRVYQNQVPGIPQGETRVVRFTLSGQEQRLRAPDSVVFELESENQVRESNYSDNRVAALVPAKPALPRGTPDLAIAGVSAQQTRNGTLLTLSVRVTNLGGAASEPSTVRVECDALSLEAAQAEVPSIRPEEQVIRKFEFEVPGARRGSTVQCNVTVDPTRGEANKENNYFSRTVKLTEIDGPGLADLALFSPRSEVVEDGKQAVFTVEVRNLGDSRTGPTVLEVTSPGTPIEDRIEVQPMDPRSSEQYTLRVGVPEDLRGTTVELVAHVDPDNRIEENNKENNQCVVRARLPGLGAGPGPKPLPAPRPRLPIVPIAGGVAAAAAAGYFLCRILHRPGRVPRPEVRAPRKAEDETAAGLKEAAMPSGAAAGAVRRKPSDDVYFTVTSPSEVAPKADFLVNVWAHLDSQREEVLKRAHQAEPKAELQAPGKGPFAIARDTELDVLLSIEDCSVEPERESIRWTGAIANAGFAVRVNEGAPEGNKRSYASVRHGGLEIARVHFLLKVTSAPSHAAVTEATGQLHRRAFASYARDDSHDVLTCIQGMEKALPGMSIFLDVLNFRSGEYWETRLQQEILASDIFYLFWSKAAADSEWVEREWRFGFEKKGLDFIDPVPLVSPGVVKPPPELSLRHFEDKWRILRAGVEADAEAKT